MRMNTQRDCMNRLISLLCVLALLSPVAARQERDSPAPSMAPTKPPKNKFRDDDYEYETDRPTPNPTPYPTKSPSSVPSQQPTQPPTFSAAPSFAPSVSPTDVPSLSPSLTPTFSPSQLPSDTPSSAPSIVPTATMQPSLYPSSLPSISPTGVLSTPLPEVLLAFRAPTDTTTGRTKALKQIDIYMLRGAIDSFLVQFMNANVSRKSFESLNANVLSKGDNEFLVTGEAYFVARVPPSEEFLKEKLITYFTYWGIRDIKIQLETAGLSLADAEIDIVVGGERVTGMTDNNNNNVDVPSSTTNDDGGSLSENSLVIGIIIAVVALVGAMIFAAYKLRTAASHRKGSTKPAKGAPQRQEQPLGTPSIALPAKESPVEESLMDDLQSQSGLSELYSMADDSLFYDADNRRGPSSKFAYDASRLDQVISNAKRSSETEGEF